MMYVTAITVFTLKASKDYLFFMAQLERFALKFHLIVCSIFILTFKLSSSNETTFVFSQTG